MQRELKLSKGFTIDPVTGYVVNQHPNSKVTPEVKLLFLKKLAELGDVADACKEAGVSRRVLTPHLRSDSKFKEDYKRARQNLKDEPLTSQKKAVIDRLWTK
jgi:hypothetical protein